MLTDAIQPSIFIGIALVIATVAAYLYFYWKDLQKTLLIAEHPPSLFKEVNNTKIHYQDVGRGRPLVLIHGLGASTYTWRKLIPYLAQKHRVICIDLPGFGRSQKDPQRNHGLDDQAQTLIQFCQDLGLEKVGLIGSSMGGAIALWMCKKSPELFSQVAVLAPATSSQLLPIELARVSKLIHPSAFFLINKALIKALIKRTISRHEMINDEMIRQYQQPYIEDPLAVKTFIQATNIISDRRLPHELSGIKSKVLVIYGAQDKLIPKAVMQQLLKVLPHAQYLEHESAGHHTMEDEPEWLSKELSEFF